MADDADRPVVDLVDLEIKLAYQDRLIRELDALVRGFALRLDDIAHELQSLKSPERAPGAANEPPPHY